MSIATDELIFGVRGGIGRILLNRPKALNSLTLTMCEALLSQLKAWAKDPAINAVVVTGAGEKAFCAGGDVVRVHDDGKAGKAYPHDFFYTEYRCNTLIKRFPKPYVALIDGIFMGGGVGLSVHGTHRVVTERTTFAMPETGIGLFPDVGGGYFLPRLPGATGMYLALTGARLKAPDCVALGIAQTYVPHDRVLALDAAFDGVGSEQIARVIESFATPTDAAPILAARADINRHFGRSSVEEIFESLALDGGAWAQAQLATLKVKSPLSLKITYQQIRNGADLSFEDCMRQEWRMAMHVSAGHDFYEGVRALLIDKDNKPQWRPQTLAEVSDAMVAAHFAPRPGDELDLSDIIAET